jgi:hypothetical protein
LTNAEHGCEEDGRQERSNVAAVQLDVVRCEIPVLFGRRPNQLFRRPGPGQDFGQSPILMKLRDGRQGLAAPSRRLVSLVSPPPSLPKPATDSSLAEKSFLRPFLARGGLHFRSLRGDIVFRPLFARQSPAAKIPFRTRRRQACAVYQARRGRHADPPRVAGFPCSVRNQQCPRAGAYLGACLDSAKLRPDHDAGRPPSANSKVTTAYRVC